MKRIPQIHYEGIEQLKKTYMKYYKILVTEAATQWRFGITEEERIRNGLIEKWERFYNKFLPLKEPLDLKLWFAQYHNSMFVNTEVGDMHDWVGNIMLDTPLSGRPLAELFVISPRIKTVLESFTMPAYYRF